MTSFFLVVADLLSTQVPEVRRVVVSSSKFCALLWSSHEMNRHHVVDAAIPHFEGAGFTFRPSHNPADELLDFVSSKTQDIRTSHALLSRPDASTFEPASAPSIRYRGHRKFEAPTLVPETASPGNAPSLPLPLINIRAHISQACPEVHSCFSTFDPVKASIERGPILIHQLILCHNRSVLQQSRQLVATLQEFALAFLVGYSFDII